MRNLKTNKTEMLRRLNVSMAIAWHYWKRGKK